MESLLIAYCLSLPCPVPQAYPSMRLCQTAKDHKRSLSKAESIVLSGGLAFSPPSKEGKPDIIYRCYFKPS